MTRHENVGMNSAVEAEQTRSRLTRHLRGCTRFFTIIVACVFALGVIAAWSASLGFVLFLMGLPGLVLVFIVGGLMLLVRGIALARRLPGARDRAAGALSAPALMIVAAMLAWPALVAGSFTGSWTRLMVNRSHYEEIIASARNGRGSANANAVYQEDQGVTYVVDAGPPVRVAFNPEGFLDNWSGIVFDPTGAVMEADGFDPVSGKFAAPDRVTKLFGGDLVDCRPLWTNYYTCSFT